MLLIGKASISMGHGFHSELHVTCNVTPRPQIMTLDCVAEPVLRPLYHAAPTGLLVSWRYWHEQTGQFWVKRPVFDFLSILSRKFKPVVLWGGALGSLGWWFRLTASSF